MQEDLIDVIEENVEELIDVEEEKVIVNTGGTQNYNDLYNKPQINGIELTGNKSLSDLGIDQDFVKDDNYVHTDNNYTSQEKNKLASLENYDDTEVKQDIQDLETNKADIEDIPDVSDFITKDVNNLTYYTTSVGMESAITNAVGTETTARQNSDTALQNQIDAITSSSDVVDVVSTYADLQNYDTTKLTDKDVLKVMQDNTHSNAISYYRWVITSGTGSWVYIGSEGPFYTKGETDSLVNAKQDIIDSTHKLNSDLVDDTNQTNKFVTSNEKQSWNAKVDTSTMNTAIGVETTNRENADSNLQGQINNKQNKPTITTDTTSSTANVTLNSNNEYRYTQELSSLTLTLPTIVDDYISFIVFASGTTATSITYDSSIKWSGDDITAGSFVPSASKTYNVVFWYDGINVNGIARSVE